MRIFNLFLVWAFFCASGVNVVAQGTNSSLSGSVLSDSIISVFRTDPDFQYVVPKQYSAKKSWIEKLRSWKNELIRKFQQMQSSRTFQIILMVLGFIALAYFFSNLGFRRRRNQINEENINELDKLYKKVLVEDTFLMELNKMEATGTYREAIRWIFLRYLAVLEKNDHIQWQSGKTNLDYYREINDPGLKTEFMEIMKTYNLSWFGYHELEQEDYAQYKNLVLKVMGIIRPKIKHDEVE